MEDSDTKPRIVSKFPSQPLTEDFLKEIAEVEKVEEVVPMKMDYQGETMAIYDFAIELTSSAYSLRFEDREWQVIAEGDTIDEVGIALQDHHHEHEPWM